LLEARAVSAAARDDAGDRARLAEEAADAFEETGDLRNACLQRISFGFACVEVGADEPAVEALETSLVVAERMGLSNSVPIARVHLGRAMARSGDLERARAIELQAVHEFDKHENRRLGGISRCYLALMAVQAGALDEAERVASEAVELLEPVPAMRRLALASLARVHLAKSEPENALERTRQAMADLDAQEAPVYGEALVRLVHVEALRAQGFRDEAARALRVAQKRLQSRAERISDAALRRCFLERVPENQQTLSLRSS
jgi:tetratricopeptide (TPR) repeat protein